MKVYAIGVLIGIGVLIVIITRGDMVDGFAEIAFKTSQTVFFFIGMMVAMSIIGLFGMCLFIFFRKLFEIAEKRGLIKG